MGRSFLIRRQGAKNGLNDTVGVCQYLIVPEPQNLEPVGFHALRTPLVLIGSLDVLAPIDLNNQLCLMRSEVGKIRANWHLAAKSNPANLAASQP